MPRIQIEATELKHTDVSFVSLVKHGANRIPFRIVKEDREMSLDLGKIGRTLFRKADAPPAVVSVLVAKTADQERIIAALSPVGLVMTQKSEADGMVVYAQPDVAAGPRDGVLRLNPDVAVIVSGLADLPSRVQKEFAPWDVDSTNFMAVLNTDGFFSGMQMAVGALQCTVANIMKDATEPGMAATMIESAIDDFKAYMLPCVSGIPVRAFKADVALRKATEVVLVGVAATDPSMPGKQPGNQTAVSASGLGAGANPNGSAFDPEEDKIRATKAEGAIGVGTQAETSPVNAHQAGGRPSGHGGTNALPGVAGGEAPIGVDTSKEPAPVLAAQEGARPTGHGGKMPMTGEASIGTGLVPEPSPVNADQGRGDVVVAGLMKQFEDFLGGFRTEISGAIEGVRRDVGGMSSRLEAVEVRTRKTAEAVEGTTIGDALDDPAPRARAQKSDGAPPLLDTAYIRRH